MGGLNAYGYCGGDPISRVDRNGHAWRLVKLIGRKLGLRSSAKAKLAMKFNANPTKVQKSDFFPNDLYTPKNKVFNFNRSLETAKFSENTFTAKLTYTENTNELFLSRFGKNNKFSFETQTMINSKSKNLSREYLTSITPNRNLAENDIETFDWINSIQNQLKMPMSVENIKKIQHPKVERLMARQQARIAKRGRIYLKGRLEAEDAITLAVLIVGKTCEIYDAVGPTSGPSASELNPCLRLHARPSSWPLINSSRC
jgi:hypothetical protein